MNSEYPLNDLLNLRDLIDAVTEHIRREGAIDAQPRTLSGFLESLLFNVSFISKTPKEWSDSLLKIMSGNLSYDKIEPLATEIISGNVDVQLLANMQSVADSVSVLPNADDLYSLLARRISRRFFTEAEIDALSQFHERGDYASFLLALVKHGFSTLYNIPCIFAERIYEEALTYDYDAPLRFSLMHEAAENGNRNAALEYGNYLDRVKQYEESFKYMLKAVPLPAAVWSLAHLIERGLLGDKQIRQCKSVLKIDDKLSKNKEFAPYRDELDHLESNNPAQADAFLTAYKIHYYLAYKGFFKSFNSMALFLEKGLVEFSGSAGKEKAERLRDKYIRSAIAGGNVPAASNEGNRLRRERERLQLFDRSSSDERFAEELLTIAADAGLMHACFYLGNYFEYAAAKGADNISLKQILGLYTRAEDLDLNGDGIHGRLFFRLAKLEENADKQIQYYEKALKYALEAELSVMSDAAYSLALCRCEKYNSDQDKQNLIKASKLLDERSQYMSEEYREKAKALQSFISEALQKT